LLGYFVEFLCVPDHEASDAAVIRSCEAIQLVSVQLRFDISQIEYLRRFFRLASDMNTLHVFGCFAMIGSSGKYSELLLFEIFRVSHRNVVSLELAVNELI